MRTIRQMARGGDIDVRRARLQLDPCVTRYSIHPPADCELVNIIGAQLLQDCHICWNKPFEFLYHKPATSHTRRHCIVAWFDDVENILNVQGLLNPATLLLNITVCPPDESCEIPYIYYDQYVDLVMLGAKSMILRMHNKPWTNLQLAVVYERSFQQGLHELTVDAHLHKTKSAFKMDFGKVF